MAENEGARKDKQFVVICRSPCVCNTPPNDKPVQYQISAELSDAVQESADVRFRGKWATTMNTYVSKVVGNEAGSGGGVNSGVNLGCCRPKSASTSVRVNGYWVLYDRDTEMWMNCNGPDGPGNTTGVICFKGTSLQASTGPDGKTASTDPDITAETPAEKSFLDGIGKKLISTDSIAALANKLPAIATMDWSNPSSVLGAASGFAGMAGLGSLAKLTGMADSVYNLSQADWRNPAAMFGAVGLAAGFGSLAGGTLGQTAGALGAVAGIGAKATNIAQADFNNPGAAMGVCMNLAGICQLAG